MDNIQLTKIRQRFKANGIDDLKGSVESEMEKLSGSVKPGDRIAVAVGSRGIGNLAMILKEVLAHLIRLKAFPYIVPAMGSHGGASAEGQEGILSGYGITEGTMGVPVHSSMEVVELERGGCPCPVYMDRYAFESDGVILINRVKPHTDYHGDYESGLVKMAVIGLGKEKQASAIHRYGVYGLSTLIPLAGKQVLSTGKILGGIGLVENALDETMVVEGLKAGEFLEREPDLLEIARQHMPSLPVKEIDLLIIDQMGKDISGVGIDPNIIGRIRIPGQEEPGVPQIKAIVILDLTDGSHGNAIGMGLAEVITRRLYDKIDFAATYGNAVTSSFLERAKIPLVAGTDREAFEIGLRSCGYLATGEERIIRIRDTLHLGEMYVSRSVMNALSGIDGIESMGPWKELFDMQEQVVPF